MASPSALFAPATNDRDQTEARKSRIINRVCMVAALLITAQLAALIFAYLNYWELTPRKTGELAAQAVLAAAFLAVIPLSRFGFRPKVYALFAVGFAFVCTFTVLHRAGEPHLLLYTAPCLAVFFFGTKSRLEPICLTIMAYALAMHIEIISDWNAPTDHFTYQHISTVVPNFWSSISFSDATWVFMLISTATLMFAATYFAYRQVELAEAALAREHARSEALLLALLPNSIMARLKDDPEKEVADEFGKVSILFADLVGFSKLASTKSPGDVVALLNRVFSRFDALADQHGLEKIKTIGDAYMVAAGLPDPHDNQGAAIAEMAFGMIAAVEDISDQTGEQISLRIGIHAGPAVAGVIGRKKPFYDVWGDTINVAARMQSTADAGTIQVTRELKDLLSENYTAERRGLTDLKGIGARETFFLRRNG